MYFKMFAKTLWDKFADKTIAKFITVMAPRVSVMHWMSGLKILIAHNTTITLLIIFISTTCAIIFGIQVYLNSSKKLINRIAVDRNGECFCPNCHEITVIERHPKGGHNVFTCKKCENFYTAVLENGLSVTANEFYAYQKENPQKNLTSLVYNAWTFEYAEKNKL